MTHQPVCFQACLQGLNILKDGVYIDGTFGRGGHSQGILDALGPQGRLIAYDRDPSAAAVAANMQAQDARLHFKHHTFSEIPEDMEKDGLAGKINGVLLDLGVSSPQLDDPARGFSFMQDGPLDMRMDPRQGRPASQWLAEIEESALVLVIRRYGEEKFARRIAQAICQARATQPIQSTAALCQIIQDAVPFYERGKHPATRTFQAIRIAVNGELDALEQLLEGLLDTLALKGRIVVLSYHSLEHRMIKNFLKKYGPGHETLTHMPEAQTPKVIRLKRIGRPTQPSDEEIANNRRARSAYLRVMERCG